MELTETNWKQIDNKLTVETTCLYVNSFNIWFSFEIDLEIKIIPTVKMNRACTQVPLPDY